MWKICCLEQDTILQPSEPYNPRTIHFTTATYKVIAKKRDIIKKTGTFAELNRKWKIPAYLPNYFSGQKGVQEKYLYMVVKINPVNGLKRNQHMAG